MHWDEELLEQEIYRFAPIRRILVDSSSLIYFDRLALLHILMDSVVCCIPVGVREETGPGFDLPVIGDAKDGESVDQRIIRTASQLQLPVVSDDRHILRAAELRKLPHYNSGMMICYLRWKRSLDRRQAEAAMDHLEEFARYTEPIRGFCRGLLLLIEKST
ncbi:MAG: hypothetical protein ACOC0D_09720 [Spirochaeta sp.]